MDLLIKECCEYFQKVDVLKKILEGFVKKYRSYDEVCGKIVIKNLTRADIEELEGFTGNNYHGKKSASFTAEAIQKILDASRFQGILLKDVLEEYKKGILVSKKEEQTQKQEQYLRFYENVLKDYEGTVSGRWMTEVMKHHEPEERILKARFRQFDAELEKSTKILLNAWNGLPVFEKGYQYLPAFAARYSGNPHYFDEGQPDTQLFYIGIQSIIRSSILIRNGARAEQKHKLLLEAGLFRDDLSNDVLIYGLKGETESGEHAGLKGFYDQGEPFSLTLSTIVKLKRAVAEQNRVYAVENPIVFAKLTEQPKISVVCTSGQPNLAVLMLLDLLVKNGTVIYYNGDFDPEGLSIAQRLKDRYGCSLKLWRYTEEAYRQALSDLEISDLRLKKMDSLQAPELLLVAECIRETKKAGYQERIFYTEVSPTR